MTIVVPTNLEFISLNLVLISAVLSLLCSCIYYYQRRKAKRVSIFSNPLFIVLWIECENKNVKM